MPAFHWTKHQALKSLHNANTTLLTGIFFISFESNKARLNQLRKQNYCKWRVWKLLEKFNADVIHKLAMSLK